MFNEISTTSSIFILDIIFKPVSSKKHQGGPCTDDSHHMQPLEMHPASFEPSSG